MLKTPREKWAFYDQLIELVPLTDRLVRLDYGRFWLMVTAQSGGVGLAQRPGGGPLPDNLVGQELRSVAALVKSWDFNQAAVGLAAINSVINPKFQKSDPVPGLTLGPSIDAFDFFLSEAQGRQVTVIGHFPYLHRFQETCNLTVLERNPQTGDLPDSAAEYLLPQSDYVFLTGTTIINKTFPRLVELSQKAKITVVGPSTPLSPSLFNYGLTALAGLVVEDSPQLVEAIKADRCEQIFKKGSRKVNLLRP